MNGVTRTLPWPSQCLAGLVALTCVAVQVLGGAESVVAALVLWLVTLWFFDRQALYPLWVPRFWLASLTIAVLSGLLLGRPDLQVAGVGVSREGLEAGLLMVMRGGFVFALSCWASRRLREHSLRRLATRLGAGRFAAACTTAFELLPQFRRLWTTRKSRLAANPGLSGRLQRLAEAAVDVLVHTVRLADRTSDECAVFAPSRSRFVAVVGHLHTGKTTLLVELARRLQQAGIAVGGVVQYAVFGHGQRLGYCLHDLQCGEEFTLARATTNKTPSGLAFDFEPEGWQWTRHHLERQAGRQRVCVLDELGLLEAGGGGHLPALQHIQQLRPPEIWLLGVRADCAATIAKRLKGFDAVLTPNQEPEVCVRRILELLPRQDAQAIEVTR